MASNSSLSTVPPRILLLAITDNSFHDIQIDNIKIILAKREQALQAIFQFSPDVVLIDTKSVKSEIPLISNIRRFSQIPIIVMSSKYDEDEVCQAFREGIDDHIIKPVGANEIIARIEAVLRRKRRAKSPEMAIEKVDDYLIVDHNRKLVVVGGQEKKLTPTEYRLLLALLKNRGQVLTKHELLLRAFGDGYESALTELRVYISYLRGKIEPDPSHPRYIHTDYRGYYFASPEESMLTR